MGFCSSSFSGTVAVYHQIFLYFILIIRLIKTYAWDPCRIKRMIHVLKTFIWPAYGPDERSWFLSGQYFQKSKIIKATLLSGRKKGFIIRENRLCMEERLQKTARLFRFLSLESRTFMRQRNCCRVKVPASFFTIFSKEKLTITKIKKY